MNYIKLLAGFFEKVADDDRLNPTHISMYVSIFQLWNANRFKNPVSISRNMVMKVCKISSTATYHKCMKELHQFGYLEYAPSYNPFKGSLVFLFDFYPQEEEEERSEMVENDNLSSKQKTHLQQTKKQTGEGTEKEVIHTKNQTGGYQQLDLFNRNEIQTSPKQALIPYTNNTNNINIKDKLKEEVEILKTISPKKNDSEMKKEKEKSCAKKETKNSSKIAPSGGRVGVPTLDAVQAYFLSKKYAPIEAEKFFNYFQSNGWLVGGKAKMKDWNAAARNWVLNAKGYCPPPKYNAPLPSHLRTVKNKNYNEPL